MHVVCICPSPQTHRKSKHDHLDHNHLLLQIWLKASIYNTRRCCWFLHHFHLPTPRPCIFCPYLKCLLCCLRILSSRRVSNILRPRQWMKIPLENPHIQHQKKAGSSLLPEIQQFFSQFLQHLFTWRLTAWIWNVLSMEAQAVNHTADSWLSQVSLNEVLY